MRNGYRLTVTTVALLLCPAFSLAADGPGEQASALQLAGSSDSLPRQVRQAAEQGDAEAQFRLGEIYLDGSGTAPSDSEAIQWFLRAATQGHAVAQTYLAVMLEQGRGIARSDEMAAGWYQAAATQGDAMAQNNLGVMYFEGRGVARDDAAALNWFRRAAEQGHGFGQMHLGFLFHSGRGVPQSYQNAAIWYELAANQGVALAQNNLGLLHLQGLGVPPNDALAADLFRRSSEQGLPVAKLNLGFVYAEGRGVPVNRDEARRLFTEAASAGPPEIVQLAQRALADLDEGSDVGAWLLGAAIAIVGGAVLLDAMDSDDVDDSGASTPGAAVNTVSVPRCGEVWEIQPAKLPCGDEWRPRGQWKAKYWCYTDMNYQDSSGQVGVTFCTTGGGTWDERSALLDPCNQKEGWCEGGLLE